MSSSAIEASNRPSSSSPATGSVSSVIVVRGPVEESCSPGSVVTIGVYDGVHLGHRHLLGLVTDRALQLGLESVVVTFDPHPAAVLNPDSAPGLISSLDGRLELLAEAGIDRVVVIDFDLAASGETAEEFTDRVVIRGLNCREVIVGSGFHFGRGREGSVSTINERGEQSGLSASEVDLASDRSGGIVSSSRIRAAVADRQMDLVRALLGRDFTVEGIVEHGDHRGRTIGFPTANVAVPPERLRAADGVYAGWFTDESGIERACVVNVGRRPTFIERADHSLVEAHVLDFDGDLYGQRVTVRFSESLRGEKRFESVDELVAQIGADCARARDLLGVVAEGTQP